MVFITRRRGAQAVAAISLIIFVAALPEITQARGVGSPGTLSQVRSKIAHRPASPPTQLYVANATSIVAYALDQNGLPATTPDWELTGGLRGAISLGFDGAGYLYVSDADQAQVRVYAPGASGSDMPVRIIPLPGSGCYLSVNPAGYLFVAYDFWNAWACTSPILIYPPGANGAAARPIHALTPNDFVFNSAFDLDGRLYIYGGRSALDVYNDPIH
jgi:hypothetical protein